jgi:ATP-binding cassette subfamily B protein
VTAPSTPSPAPSSTTSTTSTLTLTPSTKALARPTRAWRAAARTLRLAFATQRAGMAAVAAGTFVGAFIGPAVIIATGKLVDGVATVAAAHDEGSGLAVFDPRLLVPLVFLVGAVFVQRALDRVLERRGEIFADAVHLDIKTRTLFALAKADAVVVEDPQFYDAVVRAQNDATWRPHAVVVRVIGIFSSVTTLSALFSALALLHPLLLPLALLSSLPTLFVRAGVNEKIFATFWKAGAREREHNYLYNYTGNPNSHAEIKAFDLSTTLVGRVRALSQSRLDDKIRLYGAANTKDILAALVAALVLAAAYGFLIEQGVRGRLTVGDVAASLAAFASLTGHLASLLSSFLALDQHAPYLLDLYALFDRAPALSTKTPPTPLPPQVTTLSLEGVRFTYPTKKDPVLTDVSLVLRRGERVALVGANGAGKSTLVKLLLRFFDPEAGRVVVDGVDVKDVDAVALRKRIGVLFQSYAQFQLPVREGLRFGRADDAFDVARADAAVAAASARGVVDELGGYDGVAGRVLEGGHDLSGGQWQRLALARLHYRDADVWILDEPTANLDPAAEAAVFDELFAAAKDRAVLVISHRFATVRSCDRIYVIDGGTVVEEGSHDALMKKDGHYARLFRLQAKGYADVNAPA